MSATFPGDPADPQQLNRYAYVGNDPLTRYDLNGLWSVSGAWDWTKKKAKAVGGAYKGFVKDTVGIASDYVKGGPKALAEDWQQGWNTMSTSEQVALMAAPAVPAAALGGAEIAGAGGAATLGGEALSAEAPEAKNWVESLLGGDEGCADEAYSDMPSGTPNFDDPAASPGEGWEWRGNGEPGSSEGSWYKKDPRETLYPDLDNAEHGPHYDWKSNGKWYRVFPDGRIVPK